MSHVVDDGDEHGFGNHFEVMTCEDSAKVANFSPLPGQRRGAAESWIQVPASRKGNPKQKKIEDFFGQGEPGEQEQPETNELDRCLLLKMSNFRSIKSNNVCSEDVRRAEGQILPPKRP